MITRGSEGHRYKGGKTMGFITRRRWLEEGLAVLEELGAKGLTIEALTGRLGVTKGSFYHHFKHAQDFKESLLAFFEEVGTLQIIQVAELAASPQEKMQHVLQATLQPSNLGVAMRAWAFQDAVVSDSQQRIDQQRLAYLEKLLSEQLGDQKRARQIARLIYSIRVGCQHIISPFQGADLA